MSSTGRKLTTSQKIRPFVALAAGLVLASLPVVSLGKWSPWPLASLLLGGGMLLVNLPLCILIALGRKQSPARLNMIQTVMPFVVVLVLGITIWADWQFVGLRLPAWAWGCWGVVFAVAYPLCLLILVGHPPVMSLSPLLPSASERAKWRELRRRPLLDDGQFYRRFYAASGIPAGIPLRLRQLYAEQLGMDRVWPEDHAAEFIEELDFRDLLDEVAGKFGVHFSEEHVDALDGSFDSLVRCVASMLRPEDQASSG